MKWWTLLISTLRCNCFAISYFVLCLFTIQTGFAFRQVTRWCFGTCYMYIFSLLSCTFVLLMEPVVQPPAQSMTSFKIKQVTWDFFHLNLPTQQGQRQGNLAWLYSKWKSFSLYPVWICLVATSASYPFTALKSLAVILMCSPYVLGGCC